MKFKVQVLTLAMSAIAASAFGQGTVQSDDINVTVNGDAVHFRGQGPLMSQDRVFVPLRGVFQRMGAHVDWDPATQTVSADRGPTHIRLTIGLRTASINGQPTSLDLPAQIIDGTTMVPLRFVSEALGANVDWNEQAQTVAINADNYVIPHPGEVRREVGSRPMAIEMPTELTAGTMLKATLTTDVNSDTNRLGDKIKADVTDPSSGLPQGTRLEGVVRTARPRVGSQPGWLSLEFNTLVLPDGRTFPVSGTFMGHGKVGANWVHNAHFKSGTAFDVQLNAAIRFKS